MISSDLLRPISRIHHHSLPKAVIHIRRHCFGRRRLEDIEFLILKKKLFINLQGQGYKQKKSSLQPCFMLVACAPMLADKLGVPGARPRLEPDRRAVSSGCLSFCCPLPTTTTTSTTERKTSSFKSAAQTVSHTYFPNVKNVSFLFKPAFIKAIPCVFSISASDGKKFHVG